MPAKNRTKTYVAGGYYHLYNRGVEKRIIFCDAQDYAVFESYLKTYLLPKDVNGLQKVVSDPTASSRDKDQAIRLLRMNNFSDTIHVLAYCLMPNHFHILVKQSEERAIDQFMNSLCTRYSMYFNRKYKRVGPLFQGLYKAVLITSDEQLLHLTRYIHRNPASKGRALRSYKYSSYPQYLGNVAIDWVRTDEILSFFTKSGYSSYESFIETGESEYTMIESIRNIALDFVK